MSLVIHAFPPSPRSFKVLVVANHLGVEHEFRLLDLAKGAQVQPAFAAINPNKKAPALEDDGLALWESNAIIHYLAAKQPSGGLATTDPRARADVDRWLFWESTTWDPAVATLVFERFVKGFFGGGPPDAAEVEKGLENFNRAAAILDQHLADRAYICGDRLSLADFAIGAAMTVTDLAQLPVGNYPNIQRWAARLAELPAWQKTRAMQAPPAAAA